MLDAESLVDLGSLRDFLISTQDENSGGFAKYADSLPGFIFYSFLIFLLFVGIFHFFYFFIFSL